MNLTNRLYEIVLWLAGLAQVTLIIYWGELEMWWLGTLMLLPAIVFRRYVKWSEGKPLLVRALPVVTIILMLLLLIFVTDNPFKQVGDSRYLDTK